MEEVCAYTEVDLDGIEAKNRTEETNLSNMIADIVYSEYEGTDVALINCGNIRGNQIYKAGPLTQGDIYAMIGFEEPLIQL